MMEGKKNTSPIGILADALAAMTERAMAAERQRDAAKEDADNWCQTYFRKETQLREAEEKLAAERAAHQKTRHALQLALSPAVKGEG